jgi:hypothetical protein
MSLDNTSHPGRPGPDELVPSRYALRAAGGRDRRAGGERWGAKEAPEKLRAALESFLAPYRNGLFVAQ